VIPVIPRPLRSIEKAGAFRLGHDTRLLVQDAARPAGDYLGRQLADATGFRLEIRSVGGADGEHSSILLELDDGGAVHGPEGYRLSVGVRQVRLSACSSSGLFYGCQTLLQLLSDGTVGEDPSRNPEWLIPQVLIEDRPRFRWRGLHLDVSRHFMPKAVIKSLIDQIAWYKLNRFHWHLTDDQGWRIEIKRYPKLTEVGAWRSENGRRYGGFYTQDNVREIVEYAQGRQVQIVPEIEMPGHCLAALAAYPELSCTGGPFEVATAWGVFQDVYCAGSERTYDFLLAVLSEVLDLFPGRYIHIGGDECLRDRWKACPSCQRRIRKEGLRGEDALQDYFVGRIAAFLRLCNRRAIGWDEILREGLAPDVAVMSWRGEQPGADGARAGHDVVMTPQSHCYFDHYQSGQRETEPKAIGGLTALEDVYAYEPVPAGLTEAQAAHVLGAQANLWTEYVETPAHAEYMLFPRLLALSEVVWSERGTRDEADFMARVRLHLQRLERLGINHRPLEPTPSKGD
jgi:hexosaminidase